MYLLQLLTLFSVMLVSGKAPCIKILEYYHRDFGCKSCHGCPKGTGIDLNQRINHTSHGMMSCYSCRECQHGTFQDKLQVIESCKPCDKCANRKTLRNCSTTENAICGECLPEYHVKYVNGSVICEKITENCLETVFMVLWIISFLIIILLCIVLVKVFTNTDSNDGTSEGSIFSFSISCGSGSKDKTCCLPKIRLEKHLKVVHRLKSVGTNTDTIDGTADVNEETHEAATDTTFALNIGNDWICIARILNFTESDIQEIQNNERQLRDCAYSMIIRYRQKCCSQDRKSLTQALILIKRYDLLILKPDINGIESGEADPMLNTSNL